MQVFHNSHLALYRSPFGAAPVGSAVTICADVTGAVSCRCTLRLWVEGRGEQRQAMEPLPIEGGLRFTARVTLPEEPTLVWYWFFVEADGQSGYYGNDSTLGGEGAWFDHEPPAWQITVYRPYTVPDWYRRGIVYQIFPDRFARGRDWRACWEAASHPDDWVGPPRLLHESWRDTPFYTRDVDNRVTRWDFFGGTLSGVQEHLLYLRSLGVTAIYLNPIFTASSNHKYDTADYLHVDPGFGGDKAFAALASAAKACGIRLILDGVFSHTGMDSLYFNRSGNYGSGGAYHDPDSPYRSWYRFKEDGGYDCWWGVDDLPNVNETDPGYAALIYQGSESVIRRWLRAGASGWRLDVADELPDSFIEGIRHAIRETTPDGLLMGEVWEDASHKESYGQRRRYLLGDGLDCTMHYPFRTGVTEFMFGQLDAPALCAQLRSLQENYPPPAFGAALNLIGSHDRARILTLMGGQPQPEDERQRESFRLSGQARAQAVQRVKLLSLLQFTAPGVPCIYYGDEAGLEGYEDPYNRGTYPWGREDPALMWHYRDLTQLRQAHPVLADGAFAPLSFGAEVYGCLRTGEDESILALVNRSTAQAHTVRYDTSMAFALDLLTGQTVPLSGGLLELTLPPLGGVCLCLKAQPPVQVPMGRKAGILCHLVSLPGPYAAGTLGEDARRFARYLQSAGQKIWQILPLNPVGLGDSPYSSPAVFAGDTRLIDPDEPVDESRYAAWCAENAFWVEDYALFMALHDAYQRPWQQWPEPARRRSDLPGLRQAHAAAVERYRHDQFVFWQQWDALHRYVNGLGIDLVGDMPIYVSEDSVDLWAHPSQFLLDEAGYPMLRAGCPPDYFAAEGQNWKNPLYDWDAMARDGYGWWQARLRQCTRQLDAVRVDHFRAFSAYFAIPSGGTPKDGQWLKGPGLPFWQQMRRTLGQLHILAEDLGELDAGVYSLLAESGMPGMSVWQFHEAQMRQMPPEQARHRAFYTGTHDNQTLRGWLLDTRPGCDPDAAAQEIIQTLYASDGAWAILPLQDMLGLGDESRLNVPGTVGKNWCWRADPALLTDARAAWLRSLAQQTGR